MLVDERTSAGSEIVVAALKDHQRARVFGRTTLGRGSIQTITPIPGAGAIKYTSSYWQSPRGTAIHGVGVSPDVVIPQADADKELGIVIAELSK